MGDSGDRTRYWPAIEKKHGQPMEHWFALLQPLGGRKYDEQMAVLRGPWNAGVLADLAPRLQGYVVNKKTVRVPAGWGVDHALLRDMVAGCLTPS